MLGYSRILAGYIPYLDTLSLGLKRSGSKLEKTSLRTDVLLQSCIKVYMRLLSCILKGHVSPSPAFINSLIYNTLYVKLIISSLGALVLTTLIACRMGPSPL